MSRNTESTLQQSKDATSFTRSMNETLLKSLPFQDRLDFEEASRGLIHAEPQLEIRAADNRKIWSLADYQFESLDSGAPHSVNPSLWRIAQLNTFHGLFKVVERIYQVRGYDLSNMTIIEGDSKLIVIDPLVSTEVAKAALELYYQHRPRKEVGAVLYTHSHIDHFGGVRGIISEDDVPSGKVEIYAPKGFMEHAISENLYAGNAMNHINRNNFSGCAYEIHISYRRENHYRRCGICFSVHARYRSTS
jgi:alkyl sulfatase BDS1-like metallo-beta-lactamase superfamily hydrolase